MGCIYVSNSPGYGMCVCFGGSLAICYGAASPEQDHVFVPAVYPIVEHSGTWNGWICP